jgi:programmed cell death 6-interacting protein
MATTDMLLCVPLKKSSEVDIMKPLKNTIASLYSSADNPEDLSGSIGELSYMRSQALSKTLDKSPAALELLYRYVKYLLIKSFTSQFFLYLHRYYDQLSLLETKIPAQEVQIAFKWKDAFDKGSLFGGRVSLSKSQYQISQTALIIKVILCYF